MDFFLFIFVALVWGSSFYLMKHATAGFEPTSVGCFRLLIGAGLLLAIILVSRRRWDMKREHIPGLFLVAMVSYGWPFVLQPWFIRQNNASALMSMLVSFVPLLTIGLSFPMLGVRPQRRQFIGVVVGLLCMCSLLHEAWRSLSVPVLDLVLAISVPVSYAIANTYMKRRFSNVPAMSFTCAALGLAGLVLLPIAATTDTMHLKDTATEAITALLALGILGTGLGYLAFYRIVQDRGPLFAGMVSYLLPLVGMAWGWLDHERITMVQVIAMLGVLASVALVQWPIGPRVAVAAEPPA